ncbi:MAG: preprotein translocase subunit YajC [Candidatus Omnitrophica bacterium]|jgi:preprotein translocase subunit YajC|nr:preprotein translocase subunit YajC [Candidatus Omnitrophota bacterium]MCF7897962.1 preprotein translocase subunit YajC [Candidatus Omnitrophota bacterium]MCF7909994.1 preprotein translocase subunit YajC [Candidatus Omnitrophota bacterium]
MEQGGNVFYQLVPLIFLFAIFYFLLIRPQKKQQKQHQEMIANLKKNDQVVTSGGIHGTIVAVKDKTFMVRIDEGTRVQVDKNTIAYLKKEK